MQSSVKLRRLSSVPRWVTKDPVKKQSVAEHSYYVAVYTAEMCELLDLTSQFSLAAVRYALTHDWDELVTGDIPAPAKNTKQVIVKGDLVNKQLLNEFDVIAVGAPLNSLGSFIVTMADTLEGLQFAIRELEINGWGDWQGIVDYHKDYLRACVAKIPEEQDREILDDFMERQLGDRW